MHFDKGDTVALAEAVRYGDGAVTDVHLGASHPVNGTASGLLDIIAEPGGATFGQLVMHLTESYGLSREAARDDVSELLENLDRAALISVRRNKAARLLPFAIVSAIGRWFQDPFSQATASRWPCTVPGLAGAIFRFTRLPMLGWAAFAFLFFIALSYNRQLSTLTKASYVAYLLVLMALLLWSLFFHELGHLLALQPDVRSRSIIVVRGWKMAVLHAGTPVDNLWKVAVAGPLTAFALTTMLWPLTLIEGPIWLQGFIVAPFVAAAHLLSLLPFAADGKMLRKSLSSR